MGVHKLKPFIILLMLSLLVVGARAQLLHGVTDALSGGGSPTPPAGCSGTIDFSTGCVQPMLGVL